MANNLTVTRIEHRAQLAEVEAEWDLLLKRTDVASPFVTPGWQMAWLDTYGVAHHPFVLVARDSGILIGLWPLARRRRGLFRVLEPIGAGRSDWLDIPVVPERRAEVLSAFVEHLGRCRRMWDVIEHRDVLVDSPSIAALESLCSSGKIRLRRQQRTIAPYLALAGTWEQFLDSKRGKFRSNLKYYRRLPERSGQRLTTGRMPWGADDVAVDDLAAIERRSWKVRDGNLKVSTQTGREFYRRFCRYFSGRGSLEVWSAAIDSVPVAFILNIIYQGKCYHYNTCYDEAFAHISPGVLLHAEAIADAFGRGLTEYDFLSGDEPYKQRWCSNRRGIEHLTLFHWGVASLAAQAALVEARWALRRSSTLTRGRQRVLSLARKILRRGSERTGVAAVDRQTNQSRQ
jgi:CelD/BcsL family acetyltransferase involved in cellulose biosynthesis